MLMPLQEPCTPLLLSSIHIGHVRPEPLPMLLLESSYHLRNFSLISLSRIFIANFSMS
jgi:hypothetical protein